MPSRRRIVRGLLPLLSLATAGIVAGCQASTSADVQTAQMLVDIGDAVNDLRRETSDLQNQVDSLGLVIARQDTIIRQLANLAGVAR